ncbi:MAG: PAS domain S-box protein [Leptolyngbya sp. SIO4C1]|nr:PAS domain S-box protein [Leptolyngbya sp. SIO4C1]
MVSPCEDDQPLQIGINFSIDVDRHLNPDFKQDAERFRAIFEQAGVGITQVDLATGRYLSVNQRFCQLVGYSAAELLTMTYHDITCPSDPDSAQAGIDRLIRGDATSLSFEKRYVHKSGGLRWAKLTLSLLHDAQGIPRTEIIVVEDICDRKQTELILAEHQHQLESMITDRTAALQREIQERSTIEQQLLQEQALAQVTLHSIGDGVIRANLQGQVEYLNPVAEALTGWTLSQAKGQPLTMVFHIVDEATRNPLNSPVERVLAQADIVTLDGYPLLLARTGQDYGIHCSAAPIHNLNRQIVGTVIVFRDVTQARRLAQQLSWQATHDALTQLVNRTQFEQEIAQVLNTLQPSAVHVLCYLDLDQLELV